MSCFGELEDAPELSTMWLWTWCTWKWRI